MISFKQLRPFLLSEGLSDTEISNGIRILSEAFTVKRHKIDELYAKKRYVSCYSSYYMLTNMLKMDFLYGQLKTEHIEKIKKTTIIEIGTGPGTYIFSMAKLLDDKNVKYVGVDHAPLMIEQAQKIANGLFSDFDMKWLSKVPNVQGPVTYIFGNSLNEMGAKTAESLLKLNNVENILCLEPGTKASFLEIGCFRELVIKNNYNVIYPCSSNNTCPIYKIKDDWCHQVLRMKLPDDVERLGQMSQLDRKTMPAILHFYSKTLDCLPEDGRIIRLIRSVKHAFIWEICAFRDGELKTFKIEVPKKLFKKKEVKEYEKVSSGIAISFKIEKEIEEGYFRVKDVVLK